MRVLIAAVALLAMTGSAAAAPPSSCASKFAGEWRHSGGNKGTLTPDGRAICTEHAACQAEGTWTCAGNTMIYTTSLGSWTYTLMPDGSISANGGIATATRIGRGPASAPKQHDYGAASNVTADILGVDRSERPAPSPAPAPKAKPPAAQQPDPASEEKRIAAFNAHELFIRGEASANEGRGNKNPSSWSKAEDRFSEAAVQYQKAGAGYEENLKRARYNERVAKENRQLLESRPPVSRTPVSTTRVATSPKEPAEMQKRIMKSSLKCQANKKYADDLDATNPGNKASLIIRARMKEVGCPD